MDLYPRRIVCLTEETTETLYLLGAQDRIVGISGFTVRPPHARKHKPKVSAFVTADIPKIEALRPDLVLAFSDLQADIVRELCGLGYDVVVFNQRSIEEILRAVATIGALVGKQTQAAELAGRLWDNVEAARAAASKRTHRPRVFFEEWPDPLISGIRWVSELVEAAGGDDVFSELSSASLAKDRCVNPDEVIARDPEIIIGSWCGKKVEPERIRARPGWGEITAVQTDRIHEIRSSIILQPGPAALTDGLAALDEVIGAGSSSPRRST